MKKALSVLALCILGVGCQQQQNPHPLKNPWKAEAHRLSVHESILFKGGSSSLSPKNKSLLTSLLAQAQPNMKLYARLKSYRLASLKSQHLTEKRLLSIKQALKALGVQEGDIEVIYQEPMIPGGTSYQEAILVILDQYRVVLPDCPEWTIMNSNVPSHGEERFGCVTERNLAQSIADPRDLYRGQTLTAGDGTYLVNGLTRLRENKITPLKIEKVEKQ